MKKSKIEDVESFSIENNLLIYKLKNGIYICEDKSLGEYPYYGYLNTKFIQYGNLGKHYLLDLEKNVEIEVPQVLFSRGFNGEEGYYTDNYMYDKDLRRSKSDLFVYNLKNSESKKLLSNSADILILDNKTNLFFFYPSTVLKSLSLLTSSYEWETDLAHYGEIRKVLGVHENNLWVSMYRGGEDKSVKRLIVLDIQTGIECLKISPTLPISDCFIEYISEKQTILSIFGKLGTYPADSPLVEINAQTGEVIRNQRIDSLYELNLKIGQWQYFDNKIFFTANTDSLTTSHIGVLDYHTLDLLWVSEVPNRKGFLKDLQVTEDKIYVLDQIGTLHIFELTEV